MEGLEGLRLTTLKEEEDFMEITRLGQMEHIKNP